MHIVYTNDTTRLSNDPWFIFGSGSVLLTSHQGEFYGSMHCQDWNELFCDPKRMAESVLMEDTDSPGVKLDTPKQNASTKMQHQRHI